MLELDEDMQNLLAGVRGVVEATSCEKQMLWERYYYNADKLGYTKLSWDSNLSGRGVTVGYLADMPVFISLLTSVIEGQKILFVEATSQVVDWRMIETWLEENLPESAFRDGRLNKTDANNFHNVLR